MAQRQVSSKRDSQLIVTAALSLQPIGQSQLPRLLDALQAQNGQNAS